MAWMVMLKRFSKQPIGVPPHAAVTRQGSEDIVGNSVKNDLTDGGPATHCVLVRFHRMLIPLTILDHVPERWIEHWKGGHCLCSRTDSLHVSVAVSIWALLGEFDRSRPQHLILLTLLQPLLETTSAVCGLREPGTCHSSSSCHTYQVPSLVPLSGAL